MVLVDQVEIPLDQSKLKLVGVVSRVGSYQLYRVNLEMYRAAKICEKKSGARP